jgi:hypothetical protein
MKFVKIAQDLVRELMTIDNTVVIHPYMSENRLKKKPISDLDEIPKAPSIWNTYFERIHSATLSELDPEGQLVTPPSNKARNADRTALAGAPTGAGGDD